MTARRARDRPAAVRNLTIDAMTGRIVAALGDAGVDPLLLKGPVTARRLYAETEIRPYSDCDLLVAPSDLATAEATVAGLGLRRDTEWERIAPRWELHHSTWHLDDRHFDLELHWTLMHMGADPQTVWAVSVRGARTLTVGGVAVSVPGDPQLALNLALHAAQHGVGWDRPQEDLRRALDVLGPDVWRSAADRAVELDAMAGFAAGLRLLPTGARLAATLGLPDASSWEVRMTSGDAGAQAFVLDRFLRAPGMAARGRLLGRALFPPAEAVRARGDGERGLALGYLRTWWRVATRTGRGLRQLRRARRR